MKLLAFAYNDKSFFELLRNETSNGVGSHNRLVALLQKASMLEVFQACFEIDHTHAAKSKAIARLEEYCPQHVLYGGRRQVVNNVSDTHNSAELRQEAEEVELWRGNFEQPVWEDGLRNFLEDMVRHVGVQRPSQTGEGGAKITIRLRSVDLSNRE